MAGPDTDPGGGVSLVARGWSPSQIQAISGTDEVDSLRYRASMHTPHVFRLELATHSRPPPRICSLPHSA